jgi:DNA polymerase III subunit delta
MVVSLDKNSIRGICSFVIFGSLYYNEPTMIIFLYGKDTYRSKQQLAKMVGKFRAERDPQGLNLVKIDCDSAKENIMQEVLSSPFLAEKRMVVLENLLSSKQISVQEDFIKRIEEKNLPEDVVLIIWEAIEKPKLKAVKQLFERLLKEKFVQHFEELSGAKLTGWILAEVKGRGGEIDSKAANVLASSVGSDMWRLSTIIDQCIAYVYSANNEPPLIPPLRGGRIITSSDVNLFIEEKADDNVFNLVDAIVNKQTKDVYTMMQEQYRQGNDAGYLFAMILRQFRILLQLRDLYDRGENLQSSSMAKELGLHPFVIKKSLPMVKRYSLEELANIHADLLLIDKKTKTGQGDQSLMLDMFVGKTCLTT